MKHKFFWLFALLLLTGCDGCDKKEAPDLGSITYQPGIGIYPNDVLVFSVSNYAPDDSGPYSYSWDFGDGGTSTSKEPTHKFTESGQYGVTVTVTNETGSDDASVVITVGEEEGDIYFWTNTNYYGQIQVTLNSHTATVTQWHTQFPGCGIGQGFAEFIDLPWGTYSYSAISQFNGGAWSGTVEINDNCTKVLLN